MSRFMMPPCHSILLEEDDTVVLGTAMHLACESAWADAMGLGFGASSVGLIDDEIVVTGIPHSDIFINHGTVTGRMAGDGHMEEIERGSMKEREFAMKYCGHPDQLNPILENTVEQPKRPPKPLSKRKQMAMRGAAKQMKGIPLKQPKHVKRTIDREKLKQAFAEVKAGLSKASDEEQAAIIDAHDKVFGRPVNMIEIAVYQTMNPELAKMAESGVKEAINKIDNFMGTALMAACEKTEEHHLSCPKATELVTKAMEDVYGMLDRRVFPKIDGAWHV